MQFAILSIVAFAVSAFAAVVTPTPMHGCNTGPVQCCNSLQRSSNLSSDERMAFLNEGLDISGSVGQVGMSCSPVVSDAAAGGSTSCSQQAACCSDTSMNGLLAIGCMPYDG
ncbi:hypothetical protein HGRIS_014524 [Hohenbuehelia grisea]|uniref:Hydrophobin n=1 Tax=Hohenbuehelia grisea TaxID=104357 RepID=A0ABR3JTT9_9AGAR